MVMRSVTVEMGKVLKIDNHSLRKGLFQSEQIYKSGRGQAQRAPAQDLSIAALQKSFKHYRPMLQHCGS
jgi:hypothetical protein